MSITYITGTNGDNLLQGNTFNRNRILALGGEDTLKGGTNSDTLYGGDGKDRLYAIGGVGNILFGDNDEDRLYGSNFSDTLNGGRDNDTLFGNQSNDTLYGNEGNDVLDGDSGNDFLAGSSGNDTIHGDIGSDRLYGNDGNDWLFDATDNYRDSLYGGAGSDRFEISQIGDTWDVIGDFNSSEGDRFVFTLGQASDFNVDLRSGDGYIYHNSGELVAIAENVTISDLEGTGFRSIS